MKQIPVILIGGFLGSGKTTLLNRFLNQQSDQRVAVIVNDFGNVNIDSKLVAKQADKQVELTNGCICCETGEDGIEEVFETLAYEGSLIDVIVIETSGLADPLDTMKIITKIRNPYCRFDSVVYVVDCGALLDIQSKHPEINQHIKGADVIIANKSDTVSKEQYQKVLQHVKNHNSRANIIPSVRADIDTRLLYTGGSRQHASDNGHCDGKTCNHDHMHHNYQQMTFETAEDLDPKKLFDLLENPPVGVYRMKGVVNFGLKGMGREFSVQFVAGRHEIRVLPQDRWRQATTELVVIGDNYDEVQISQRLAQLVDDGSEPPSADTILDIFMFE